MNPLSHFNLVFDEIHPVLSGMDTEAFENAVRFINEGTRIFLAGAGRSGLLVRMFAMRLAQAGLTVHVAGDATAPSIRKDDLLIIASGSGQTGTMRALAAKAKTTGARLLLLTYTPGSPLMKTADATLLLPVPIDPARPGGVAGQQHLGTLFDQCLMFTTDALAQAIADARGETDAAMQARHANLE